MSVVISIINQKGGVGKTTTAINLCSALSKLKKRILIIDLDAQCNTTTGLQQDKNKAGIADVMGANYNIESVIYKTQVENLYIIPGSYSLSKIEQQLFVKKEKEYILKNALKDIKLTFDTIIIDCPPSLGILPTNALVASDGMIIPVQSEFYAMEGLSKLLKVAALITKSWNPGLQLYGIIVTMFDKRNKISKDILNEISDHMGSLLFDTIIPRNIKIVEAQSHGAPINCYDQHSISAQAYADLAGELLQRI